MSSERFYTVAAKFSDGESVVREFQCESQRKAMSLMKAKFSEATSIELVSARDVTLDDEVEQESSRVESELHKLDLEEEKSRQRKTRGIVIMVIGVVGTIALYLYGWISWFTLVPIVVGLYEYSNGSWGVKRAKRLKSWEMEKLSS